MVLVIGGLGQAIYLGAGVAIGSTLIWLFKYRPDRARIKLLLDGRLVEFHASVDEALNRTRNTQRRNVLLMNKASAYAQGGEFGSPKAGVTAEAIGRRHNTGRRWQ